MNDSPISELPAGTKVLIFTCDEFGECHSSNAAIVEAMEKGLGIRKYAVGATIMMPAPWVPEAIDYALSHPKADVGVHLMIGDIHKPMKCRPLCDKREVPGLYSPEGYSWGSSAQAWEHSNEKEVYKECRAQIEMALGLGVDVTHIDGHGGFQGGNYAAYSRVCGALAEEFRLPLRMQPRWRYQEKGAEGFRDQVLSRGVIVCDDDTGGSRLRKSPGESFKEFYLRRLRELSPGLTDLYVHPSVDSSELRALLGSRAQGRVEQYHLLVHDQDFSEAVREAEVCIVNWRDVRELGRSGSSWHL